MRINNIPSIIWGERSNKVLIAVHGNMSNKEDEVIKILAEKVVFKGYQLLSFDLPEHGERKENKEYLCKVQKGDNWNDAPVLKDFLEKEIKFLSIYKKILINFKILYIII